MDIIYIIKSMRDIKSFLGFMTTKQDRLLARMQAYRNVIPSFRKQVEGEDEASESCDSSDEYEATDVQNEFISKLIQA